MVIHKCQTYFVTNGLISMALCCERLLITLIFNYSSYSMIIFQILRLSLNYEKNISPTSCSKALFALSAVSRSSLASSSSVERTLAEKRGNICVLSFELKLKIYGLFLPDSAKCIKHKLPSLSTSQHFCSLIILVIKLCEMPLA